MRQAVAMAAFLLLLCCGSSLVRAQGNFDLQYRQVEGSGFDDPVLSMAAQWLSKSPGKPPQLKGRPEGLSKKISYYVGQLGGKDTLMLIESTRPPRLFVDTDADGDLSDEKPVVGERVKGEYGWGFFSRVYRFGPVSLAVPGAKAGTTAGLLITKYHFGFLMVSPAGHRAGEVRLAGKSYRVALIDGNFDGRYDTGGKFPTSHGPGSTSDFLAIDLNGNGNFEYNYFGSMELQPLPKLLRPEDTYYAVEAAPDGSTIRLTETTPKLGTLNVGRPDVELMLWSDSGVHHLTGSEGKWQVPVGQYSCWALNLNRTDEKKDKWTLRCNGKTGKLQNFEIHEGKTVSFKVGPPLMVKTNVTNRRLFFRRAVAVQVAVTGQSGEEYGPGAERNGKPEPAPGVKIFDESGKAVASGKFEYG